MSLSSPFRVRDDGEARAMIRAYPLALLAVNGPSYPVTALVPLVLSKDGEELLGHLARAHPFAELARQGAQAVRAVFQGPNAYISPGWYPSKAEHGRAVPTWNYLSVEVSGTLRFETNPESMVTYLELLTAQMEQGQSVPWSIDDAPAAYTQRLSRAIIGLKIEIEHLQGVRKLSQNKAAPDLAGVVQGLEARQEPAAMAVAAEMMKERRI